jgi:hypothetical protein
MQCCSTFQGKQAEILASEGFGENLQQILIQKYFFKGYPQLVHRPQQRTKSDESIPPFIPSRLLQAGCIFKDKALISLQGSGEKLDHKSRPFLFVLLQKAVEPVIIEQPGPKHSGDILLQLPRQPGLQDVPPDLAGNIIDDLIHAFPEWILPF